MILEKELATATLPATRQRLEGFRASVVCPDCGGSRLRPEARNVRFEGRAIHEIAAMSTQRAAEFFASIEVHPDDLPIYQPLANEIRNRLAFLGKVGLDYLTLDRPADTLSGGELQRVRLTTAIGSGLVGVCYILDEPSIGLHPRDNQRLIECLRQLQEQENTVLVVEHDQAMMLQADHLIDIGPGAGLARRANRRSGNAAAGLRFARFAHRAISFRPAANPGSRRTPALRQNPHRSRSKAPRRTISRTSACSFPWACSFASPA